MTTPVDTAAPVRDVTVVATDIKRLTAKLGKVDTKAAESEVEVQNCNDTMLKMMQGEIPQTGANNIAVIAKEQQKHMKKAEKIRENAVEDAKTLTELQAELNGMVDALVAPYKAKFVDNSEPTIDEDADGVDEVEEEEAAE